MSILPFLPRFQGMYGQFAYASLLYPIASLPLSILPFLVFTMLTVLARLSGLIRWCIETSGVSNDARLRHRNAARKDTCICKLGTTFHLRRGAIPKRHERWSYGLDHLSIAVKMRDGQSVKTPADTITQSCTVRPSLPLYGGRGVFASPLI